MKMAIDWENLTFKGKDVILLTVFVGGFVFNYASNNEKLNTIIENQSANKELFKDYGIRLSIIETEQKLLKQRVDAWESSSSQAR